MRARRYHTAVTTICYPDGRVIGFMICVNKQWFGPYLSADVARLI